MFCSSSDRMEQKYYDRARELGEWMGRSGKTLVYGGIKCGMMEVLAQAVHGSGGRVVGVVPTGLKLRETQSDVLDVTLWCEDLTDRKVWLMQESEIVVVLPGSVGTLDEAFTVMGANQVGMHDKRTVFYNVDGFYDTLRSFLEELNGRGVVNKPWSEYVSFADTLEEVVALCER